MATTPATFTASIRGIDAAYTDASIEDITVTKNVIAEQVPDQYGAIAVEMVYDHRWDLTLTMHATTTSAPTMPGDTFTFDAKDGEGSKTWQTDSCAKAGSYQNVTRWTITAHRFDNSPAAASQGSNT